MVIRSNLNGSNASLRTIYACILICCLSLLIPLNGIAQDWPSRLELGVLYGVTLDNGEFEDERIGLQATLGLWGPVEIAPAVSYFTNYPDLGSQFSGTAWQGYLTARVRLFGPGFPAALGYGITFARQSLKQSPSGVSSSLTDATDVAVVSLQVPGWRVRPFVDLYLLDIFERKSAVTGNLLGGVAIGL
ncbi:hypothetical protein MJD09_03740 [bacterium]|nr:hypothetical protein [bacterium]